jgi:hypothetical protein
VAYWRQVRANQWLLWPSQESADRGESAVRAVVARPSYASEDAGPKYVAGGGRRQSVHSTLDAAQRAAEESAEDLLSR